MADEFTAKFKVDISDLKKNITEANKQIKLANATFKSETAGMENWSKNADGLSAKLKQLDSVLKEQKSQLSAYKTQLDRQKEAYDENGKRAEQLKAKLKALAEQGVAKTDEQYKKYQSSLKSVIKEQQNNEKAIDDLNVTILEQEAAVKKTETQVGKYKTSLSNLKAEQKAAEEAANRQKTAYESLDSTIDKQQSDLNELKTKYANVVLEQGKGSDAAKKLAGEIDSLSSELAENKTKLNDADNAADELDNSLDDVGSSAEEASGGFTIMKGALADLVSAGIQAAIQGLKDLAVASYEAWQAYDEGADTIIAATGATGEAAEELIGVYENVAKSVVGDFGDIGTAVGEVNTRFGLTGDELQKTSEKFLKFAELNGTDVKTAIDNTQSAMAAFGLEASDTSDFLDVLNKAGQDTGVSVDKLAQDMVANAPALQEMGYNASDAAMFIANLGKNGVDASSTLSGMKKALANAAAEGKPMSTAMAEVESSIKNATTSTEAIQIATELFGAKAGPAIATAVRDGKLSFEDFGTTLTDFQGNIDTTYESMLDGPDKVQLAFQNLKVEVAKVFDAFLQEHGPQIEAMIQNFTENILPKLMDVVSAIMDGVGWFLDNGNTIIGILAGIAAGVGAYVAYTTAITVMKNGWMALTVVQKAVTAAQWLMNAAMNANPIGIIISLIAALVAAFTWLWNNSEEFRQFWINLWENIKNIVSTVVTAIKDFFVGLWDGIKAVWSTVSTWFMDNVITPVYNFFSGLIEGITGFFSSAWETIKGVWETVSQWFFDNVITPVSDFFSGLVEGITGFFSGLWEGIKEIWSVVATWFNENVIMPVANFFTGLWDGIKNAASAAWEGIKGVWNAVTGWFNNTIITPVKNAFSNAWNTLKTGASNAWEGIKGVFKAIPEWFKNKFSSAWQKVKDVFSTGGKIFTGIKEGIVSAFKAVVNAIIRGINKVIALPFNAINGVLDKIRSISIFGLKPFGWVGSIGVPQIPELAKGGVLKRGQVGLLEGDGTEAVVPLERNKQWIRAVASELLDELRGTAGFGGINNSSLNNSRVMNYTQNIYAPQQPSRIELYRQTKNLLALAERGI